MLTLTISLILSTTYTLSYVNRQIVTTCVLLILVYLMSICYNLWKLLHAKLNIICSDSKLLLVSLLGLLEERRWGSCDLFKQESMLISRQKMVISREQIITWLFANKTNPFISLLKMPYNTLRIILPMQLRHTASSLTSWMSYLYKCCMNSGRKLQYI